MTVKTWESNFVEKKKSKQKQINKHRVNFRVKVSEMRLLGGGLSTASNELQGGLIYGVNVDL